MSKLNKLKSILKNYPGVIAALSGGVDSSLLLQLAKDVLNDRVVAVTAISPLHPKDEVDAARKVARKLKCRHIIVQSWELKNPQFTRNPRNRCYFCKRNLFKNLQEIASRYGFVVIEGSNTSDLLDYRPGLRALQELGIKSPFIMAGFDKHEIRLLAKKLQLENWNKPATACLASRIPYGTPIDEKILRRIRLAERYVKNLTVTQVRVRDHYPIARIEVQMTDFQKVLKNRTRTVRYFRRLGYKFISLDLEGYQIGSLNR
ncbi:MAG: ATP-dependent sacrificial sulfur transferase LarE [candidate division WOR-3 bacterium]|nr:MAG: ATP-dependent sacrificial sulfur transferase LarE [candidate division WOR-3 bacterium]